MTTSSAQGERVDAPTKRRTSWLFRGLALALLCVALLLLAGQIAHYSDAPGFLDVAWNGDFDGSFVEVFGYIQLLAASVLLVILWGRRRAAIYGAWALTLAVLAADDLLMIHEYGGEYVARALRLQAIGPVEAQELGEFAIWTIMAVPLGAILLIAHRRANKEDRRMSRVLFALLVLLAVFTVGVDLVNSTLDDTQPILLRISVTLVESAGELLVMSVILIVVLRAVMLGTHGPANVSSRR